MQEMKRVPFVDDLFLRLESRRMPLNIGLLMLFQPPPGAPPDFVAQLGERLRQSTTTARPFDQLLRRRRGLHYWVKDRHFDLENHFVETHLSKPGRIRELLAMVSRIHATHFDRSYPLWRVHLIDGLEDGRFAVYCKIHHSMVDGVSLVGAFTHAMADSPEGSMNLPPPWEVETAKSGEPSFPVPTGRSSLIDTLSGMRTILKERSVLPLLRELKHTFRDFIAKNEDLTIAGRAPRTLFNSRVSGTRRFAAQSYSTSRMRAVAKHFGGTLNDIVLAMCASALRRYLEEQGGVPERPLIAGVPVSTREDDDEDFGNQVAFTLTSLATQIADPVERFRAIKKGMDYNKRRIRQLNSGQLLAYAAMMLLPGLANEVLRFSKDTTLGTLPISHIPGPRKPMYWNGAKLDGMYFPSLLIEGGTLNITLISRDETVDFGLIACRKSVPHMQRLLGYLEDGLVELERAIAAGA